MSLISFLCSHPTNETRDALQQDEVQHFQRYDAGEYADLSTNDLFSAAHVATHGTGVSRPVPVDKSSSAAQHLGVIDGQTAQLLQLNARLNALKRYVVAPIRCVGVRTTCAHSS